MKHKGDILQKAIEQSGMNITEIAKKINKSRGWFYNVFKTGKVSIDTLLQIGKVIHYDFASELKELKKYKTYDGFTVVQEPETLYKAKKGEDEQNVWKEKYFSLLEEHNALLKKQQKLIKPKPKK
jgi:hypothetical protein